MSNQKGFSLVELLIVVAIIAIIVAIAIPNLLTSRQAAQASAAAGDLRTINSAEIGYAAGAGNGSYGNFDDLMNNRMLPTGFASTSTSYTRNGYNGTLSPTASAYSVVANPISGVSSPQAPSYFTDESGAIRYATGGGAADSTSTPLGQSSSSGS